MLPLAAHALRSGKPMAATAAINHTVEGRSVPHWPQDIHDLPGHGTYRQLTSTYDTVRFPGTSQLPISLSFTDGIKVVHDIEIQRIPCGEVKVLVPMPREGTKHLFNEHRYLIWEGMDLKERTLVHPNSTVAMCTFSYTGEAPFGSETPCAPEPCVLASMAHTHGIRIRVQTFGGENKQDKAHWEKMLTSGISPRMHETVSMVRKKSVGTWNARVHLALLLTQFCWGSAAVCNKLGLSGVGMNPLLFALVRETTAAPLLFLMLAAIRGNMCPWSGWNPASALVDSTNDAEPEDQARSGRFPSVESLALSHSASFRLSMSFKRVVMRFLPGVFIFLDQLCGLTGVKLASATSAAAWQPSQVIFTISISVCIGAEELTWRKAAGIALTVAGASCLVFLGTDTGVITGGHPVLGQCFFLMSCLASSLEVILWRKLLRHSRSPLGHMAVMAESYLCAAALMIIACLVTSQFPAILEVICPECDGNAWSLPLEALWAVGYSVVFQTIIGYCAQAWALKYAESSLVTLYAAMQPVTATALSCALLAAGWNPQGALVWPGREMSGGVLIILGLAVTVRSRSRQNSKFDADNVKEPLLRVEASHNEI